MSVLAYTKIETHPLGTVNPNGIIDDNWSKIDAIFQATSFWAKSGNINGLATATTTLANPTITTDNPSGFSLIVDKILIVPVTFTGSGTNAQIEIGENVVGTSSLVAAVTPTLTASQIQDLALVNPRPLILGTTGSLKIKVDTAAVTFTAWTFQIWTKFLLR